MKKVLILGVNGFIGHHLSKRILETTDWEVYGMDMNSERITELLDHPRMHFFEGDITINKEWVEYHVKKCDVILPLVAIATPSTYVQQPLKVFELDFEANLPIVRSAAKYKKHLVFPSTSEVYGMCHDGEFDPENSELVYGPINKPRWIYACSKQLMDRVIWGYGMEGLNFTLFRPFNWIGAGLDSIHTPKEGSSRVARRPFALCLLPLAFCLSFDGAPVGDDAHDVGLGGELAFDVRLAVHLLDATADAKGRDRDDERVAGKYWTAEARVVNAAEEDELVFAVLYLLERVDRADLRHRLDDEDAGHDGRAGKVALEEVLAHRHLLDADDADALG